MTLSDLERRGLKNQIFLADLHNYARTDWPRMTEFSVVTRVGEKHISWESATPTSQRAHNYCDPTYAQTVWPRTTKFGKVTHVGSSVFLGGQPRPRPKKASPEFLGPLPTYAPKVWHRTTMGQERVGDQPLPISRVGPQRPPNFWDLLYARTRYEKRQPNFAW